MAGKRRPLVVNGETVELDAPGLNAFQRGGELYLHWLAGVALQDIPEHARHSNLDTTRKHYIMPTIETSRRVATQRVAFRRAARQVTRDKP
jgi:hypothetical protein